HWSSDLAPRGRIFAPTKTVDPPRGRDSSGIALQLFSAPARPPSWTADEWAGSAPPVAQVRLHRWRGVARGNCAGLRPVVKGCASLRDLAALDPLTTGPSQPLRAACIGQAPLSRKYAPRAPAKPIIKNPN